MAFTILNEEQLLLLTDEQKQQYEQALALYQQRARLVEQAEKYDRTKIPPYETKLAPLAPIRTVQVPVFRKKDHTPDSNPVQAPKRLKIKSPAIPKAKMKTLPEVAVPTAKYSFVKPENPQPKMPECVRLTAFTYQYQPTAPQKPTLPKLSEKPTPSVTFVKPTSVKAVLPEERPERLKMDRNSFIGVSAAPVLPEIGIPAAVAAAFSAPEPVKASLPQHPVPKRVSAKYEKPEPVQSKLPEKNVACLHIEAYAAPEKKAPVLPKRADAPRVSASFVWNKAPAPKLPKIEPATASVTYTRPQEIVPSVPAVAVERLNVAAFTDPILPAPMPAPSVPTPPVCGMKDIGPVNAQIPPLSVQLVSVDYTPPMPAKANVPAFGIERVQFIIPEIPLDEIYALKG